MARIMACDNCGQPAQLWSVGLIEPREYCETCLEIARAYLAAVDAAHEQTVLDFQMRLEEAKERHKLAEYPC